MKRVLAFVLVLALAAIWLAAGYRIGLTRGKGWRAAVIRDGCTLRCGDVRSPAVPFNKNSI